MRAETRAAICALIVVDPSITPTHRQAIENVLDGRGIERREDTAKADNVLKRSEVARMLKCTVRTVTQYAKRGLIRPIRLGRSGVRACGYSAESVATLIAQGA